MRGLRAARVIDDDVREVTASRRWLAGLLRDCELDPEVIDTAVLCFSELVTNALCHGGPPREARVVVEERVRLEVLDGMPARPRKLDPDVRTATGRGIAIVEQLSTEWGTAPADTGKRVWCVLQASPA